MSDDAGSKVHWGFWVVGAVGLIFNLLGSLNFVSQMNAEVVASMPDIYRAMIESRPAWGTVAFGVAVFGGLLGCVLLLLRKSVATYVFVASLVGTVAAQVPYLGMAGFPKEAWIGWLSQVVVGVFLIFYSKRAESKRWIN